MTTKAGDPWTHIQLGDLLSLLGAAAFAAHLLTLARTAPRIPAGLLATLQILFCTFFLLITLPLEQSRLTLTPRLVVALLVCGLLATAAAFTIQSFAQQHLPATQTALVLTLEPVFGALTSLAVLHETLTPRAMGGAALILAGILLTEWRAQANEAAFAS